MPPARPARAAAPPRSARERAAARAGPRRWAGRGPPPASLAATHLRRGALEFGPRQGRQTEATKAVLILEEERQPQRVVGPPDAAHAGARGIRAEIEHIVGL